MDDDDLDAIVSRAIWAQSYYCEGVARLCDYCEGVARLCEEIRKLRAVVEAVTPLCAEWRGLPTMDDDDDIYRKRLAVVEAFDSLERP